ncbi:hypothetical protein JCM5296_007220 [Sporobolomyces johnsonii]
MSRRPKSIIGTSTTTKSTKNIARSTILIIIPTTIPTKLQCVPPGANTSTILIACVVGILGIAGFAGAVWYIHKKYSSSS